MSTLIPPPVNIQFFRFISNVILYIFLLVSSSKIDAQVRPSEGSVLNYRIVGISFNVKQEITRSVIEISKGHYERLQEFKGHVYQIISTDSNRVVIELPLFGNEYTWRVVHLSHGKRIDSSNFYHFSTAAFPVDADKRLRVTKREKNHRGAYFFVDGMNALFDADGNPIWFLPGNNLLSNSTDLKVSKSGTITFLSGPSGYEVSYSGNVLWSTKDFILMPDGSKTDIVHHHEFTKISNGHFMALTAKISTETAANIDTGQKRFFPIMSTGSIKEYDEQSNEVWSWEAPMYAMQSDMRALMERYSNVVWDLHENAFFFDERTQTVYLSLAGIDRMLKIQYPSGKVLAEYGNKISPNELIDSEKTSLDLRSVYANKYFHNPHALKYSVGGNIYLCSSSGINNNAKTGNWGNGYPKILKLKESGDSIKNSWELDCRKYLGDKINDAGGGGNVVPISDSTLFVSMCNPHNEMFIVNTRKELLWSAVTEIYQPYEKTWGPYPRYRASVVTRKQLEQMIWSER